MATHSSILAWRIPRTVTQQATVSGIQESDMTWRLNHYYWNSHWRRKWQPTPEILPGEFHGQRNLTGFSPWGHRELDTTEWLTHTQLSYALKYRRSSTHNCTPLQYSCLENPMDRGAWKAAVHGVAKDTTERLHFHFSLPCIGEGNGNPRQCSCLENPRDEGAQWAAVYRVAQCRTRLKRLSSNSSSSSKI